VSKNVAVFVDVANIFYAAKAAGVDIDYVTLLKSASAGRDLVRAYAYTGLDPENENQRNFHSFLARNNYKVVSKDIRKYGDGKVKANLDIELVVDMMKTARNLDIAIVVSGDGDFAPAIRAVQEMGVRVEVISFRGNTSSDLMEVADQFTDITALAKVEKGSARSGRRVAGDEEDLSMTEVPDKQTEGVGGRSRGRGRGRGQAGEAEPVAATSRTRRARVVATVPAGAGAMVAMPGEKLSKASAAVVDEAAAAVGEAGEPAVDGEGPLRPTEEMEEAGRRRRRRRGGRGRGRGRSRADGLVAGETLAPGEEAEEEEPVPARGPRPTPFGSVWDSQLGTSRPAASASSLTPLDEEDLEEPEIPEYLIAEQRRGRSGQGGARGARGGRGAYAAAMDRERYGRGGGGGGINRYPDVGARDRDRGARPRGEPFRRPERAPARSGGGSEPWSEVPPELEAMLRAQLAAKPRPSEARSTDRPEATAPKAEATAAEAPPRRGRGRAPRRTAEGEPATAPSALEPAPPTGEAAPAAPKRRATRRTAASAAEAAEATSASKSAPVEAPRRRTTRAKPAAAETGPTEEAAPAAPKRRTTRRTSTTATDAAGPAAETAPAEAPKRRATRRKPAAAEAESA